MIEEIKPHALYTLDEVAEHLRLSTYTVGHMARKRLIASVKTGNRVVIKGASLTAYITRNTKPVVGEKKS
jgi:excisionase family DNA binding protein